MRHNVFLHFLNRDANLLTGAGNFITPADHKRLLSRALNVCVMLCDGFCIAPPGFLLETDIALKISHQKRLFITNGIIKLARKESNMDDFVEKKRKEYASVSHSFKGLFNDRYILQLTAAMPYFVLRKISVGIAATRNWEEGPDKIFEWETLRNKLSNKTLNELIDAPRKLLEDNTALTWEALMPYLNEEMLDSETEIRNLLQHNYFSLYTQEYKLIVLQDIPNFSTEFNLPVQEKSYSYLWFRTALLQLKTLQLMDGSAELVCTLVQDRRFIEFVNLYMKSSEMAGSINDFKLMIDRASKASKVKWERISAKWIDDKKTQETNLNAKHTEELLQMFEEFSYALSTQIKEMDLLNIMDNKTDGRTSAPESRTPKLERVVFSTANEREYKAVVESLKLETEMLKRRIDVQLNGILPYTRGYLPAKGGVVREAFVVRADDTGGLDAVNLLRRVVDTLNPKFIFYVGCSALLDEKYQHKNNLVFVAARAIDADKKELTTKGTSYDMDLEKSDVTIIRNINVLKASEAFDPIEVVTNRHFISSSAFSGDRNSQLRKDLIDKFPKDAVVLEMEAYAVLKEIKKYHDEGRSFNYAVIKGISDMGDENAQVNKNESQKKATANATTVIITLLKNV